MSSAIHPTSSDGSVPSAFASAVILGPLVPSIFALVTVILSQFVQLTSKDCSPELLSDGCQFMTQAAVVSYLFIIVFAWTFVGTTVSIKLGTKTFRVLRPFSRVRTIAALYFVIFLFSLVAFGLGLVWILSDKPLTKDGEPIDADSLLISVGIFLQIVYWIIVIVCAISLVMIKLSSRKGAGKAYTVKVSKKGEVKPGSEQWFKEKFEDETEGLDVLESDNLGRLLTALRISMSDSQVSSTVDLLDVDGTGEIQYSAMWNWFEKTGKSMADLSKKGAKDADSDDEGSDD